MDDVMLADTEYGQMWAQLAGLPVTMLESKAGEIPKIPLAEETYEDETARVTCEKLADRAVTRYAYSVEIDGKVVHSESSCDLFTAMQIAHMCARQYGTRNGLLDVVFIKARHALNSARMQARNQEIEEYKVKLATLEARLARKGK